MEASDTSQQQPDPTAPADPGVQVPKLDHNPETPEEVSQLAAAFAEYRSEVAALRKELAAHRPRTVQVAASLETEAQRRDARLTAIAEHSHYCPGCGTLGHYPQKCTGPVASPHPALEMVPTEELSGDPANHTAAPATEELAA